MACAPSMTFRVKVRVEESSHSHTFIFARGRLCVKARYFAKALDGPFIEAQTGMIVLDDISIQDFRHFSVWILTDRLLSLSLDSMVQLYALADRFDAQDLRATITERLALECFRFNAPVPASSTLAYVVENIPQSLPLYHLLANSVARPCYHDPSLLESLPREFLITVEDVLTKPYGLCDDCYHQRNCIDTCDHFFDQPPDYDPARYTEAHSTQDSEQVFRCA